MPRKKKAVIGQVLLTSMAAGLLISFGFQPLYEISIKLAQKYINLGPWNDIIVMSVLGTFYLGLMIYLLTVTFLNSFARSVFKVLLYEMRCKELLPPGFKVKKRRRFNHVYEDIMEVFDNFVHNYFKLKKEKEKYSKTVDTYLDPSLKQEIETKGIHEMYVGGKKKTATILFCDLRGFTAFTENHDPHDVVKILNDYFTFATAIITRNRGRVNKYIGDAILAVFEEAPKYIDYIDADKAIISGLDIQTQFKLKMREWIDTMDPTLKLGLGVGIARGEIVTGNMGSEERMEYTVIGDTVNFASRLCGKAKDGEVIISKEVYSMVEQLVNVNILPPVEVKGKAGTHEIYSVLTRKMII